jgi:hypothetical protein
MLVRRRPIGPVGQCPPVSQVEIPDESVFPIGCYSLRLSRISGVEILPVILAKPEAKRVRLSQAADAILTWSSECGGPNASLFPLTRKAAKGAWRSVGPQWKSDSRILAASHLRSGEPLARSSHSFRRFGIASAM